MITLLFFLAPLIYFLYYLLTKSTERNASDSEKDTLHADVRMDIKPTEENSSDTVVIYSANTLLEAQLIQAQLENEGVYSEALDIHTISVHPLLMNAIGGIRIIVRKEDAEKAHELIEGFKESPLVDNDGEPIRCPLCGSDDFWERKRSSNSRFMDMSLRYSLKTAAGDDKELKCKACDHVFVLDWH